MSGRPGFLNIDTGAFCKLDDCSGWPLRISQHCNADDILVEPIGDHSVSLNHQVLDLVALLKPGDLISWEASRWLYIRADSVLFTKSLPWMMSSVTDVTPTKPNYRRAILGIILCAFAIGGILTVASPIQAPSQKAGTLPFRLSSEDSLKSVGAPRSIGVARETVVRSKARSQAVLRKPAGIYMKDVAIDQVQLQLDELKLEARYDPARVLWKLDNLLMRHPSASHQIEQLKRQIGGKG